MVTKITFNMQARIDNFCTETIGRTPKTIDVSNGTIILFFDPSLTPTEKNTLSNALPDLVKKFWRITVEEV